MNDNWQTKTLIIGAVIGLITGLAGAGILIQASDKTGNRPQLTAGDGLKVSLGVMAVLRLLWDLGTH
jgi:hypothetical protein